jgi:hypothetical protein
MNSLSSIGAYALPMPQVVSLQPLLQEQRLQSDFSPRLRRCAGRLPHCQTTRAVLVLFLARLLPAALASKGFLHPFLFTGLQIKGVTFHFLDNVFLLHLPFETAKRVLEGLALLNSDFSQRSYTPLLVPIGPR